MYYKEKANRNVVQEKAKTPPQKKAMDSKKKKSNMDQKTDLQSKKVGNKEAYVHRSTTV